MDIERRRQEANEYRRKPRLIEDNEIPEGIVKASQHFIDEEKEPQKAKLAEPIGRRHRKEVDYRQVAIDIVYYYGLVLFQFCKFHSKNRKMFLMERVCTREQELITSRPLSIRI